MLKALQQKNKLLPILIKGSTLTNVEVDTLLCELEGKKTAKQLKERVALRDRENITLGAYSRTRRQAYTRISKALKTLLLLSYLGILTQDRLNTLLKAAELLNKIKTTNLTIEDSIKINTLIEETIRSLVVISQ
ncbi:MAG: hypothetical protein ACK4TI_01065 [Nitrososphaerales archaeon]